MKKMYDVTAMTRKAIRLIYREGATWEDISEMFGLSIGHIQRCVKNSYSRKGNYQKLLMKARLNKAAKQQAESQKAEPEIIEEVILVDTGFVMRAGVSWLMQQSLPLYIPAFCLRELERMSKESSVAEQVLTFYWSTRRMSSIELNGKEILLEEPKFPLRKARSRGVVAAAVKLLSLGNKVRLYTNSLEVEQLALHQGSPHIDPIYQSSERIAG